MNMEIMHWRQTASHGDTALSGWIRTGFRDSNYVGMRIQQTPFINESVLQSVSLQKRKLRLLRSQVTNLLCLPLTFPGL